MIELTSDKPQVLGLLELPKQPPSMVFSEVSMLRQENQSLRRKLKDAERTIQEIRNVLDPPKDSETDDLLQSLIAQIMEKQPPEVSYLELLRAAKKGD